MKYANIKVYKVKFLKYTNCMEDTVSDDSHYMDFLDIPKETSPYVLLREDQLNEYRRYGNGYASAEFVGYMINDEDDDDE